MTGYTKLFSSIVSSTIWREDKETKIVWITMLAMADKDGIVEASVPGLADLARVTIPECQAALAILTNPDEFSRTKDHEGRRIEEIDGGWRLLNHAKYRAKMSYDDRREYHQRYYEKRKSQHKFQHFQQNSTDSRHTEAEAHTKAEAKAHAGMPERAFPEFPTIQQVIERGRIVGLAEWKCRDWWNEMEGCGWIDYHSRPVKNWQAVMDRVRVKWEADGRPSGPPASKASLDSKGQPMETRSIIEQEVDKAVLRSARHSTELDQMKPSNAP